MPRYVPYTQTSTCNLTYIYPGPGKETRRFTAAQQQFAANEVRRLANDPNKRANDPSSQIQTEILTVKQPSLVAVRFSLTHTTPEFLR
jgi:hypothetical protein